jgi:hypothetical protein
MTGDARMFNSIDSNGNHGYDSIIFGDNGKGKVKGFGKIAISNDMSESASKPFMGFGELSDNTIKGLTSLLSIE